MQLHFRIQGISDREIRLWRNADRRAPAIARLLFWAALGALLVYSAGTLAPERNIEVVVASSLLVITDVSGSMRGTEDLLARQLERLASGGVSLSRETALGFGVGSAGWDSNFLHRLQSALAAGRTADAIYLFSDFTYIDEPIDGSDAAGYAELRRILSERSMRLYLGTVREQPPAKLIEIAEQSGGGVIRSE